MGVPTSEVGYTPAMPRREDHEVHKDMLWHWTKKIFPYRLKLKKYINLLIITFRKNKNYNQKRTAQLYTVASLLLNNLMQLLTDVTY